jgi:hypothetical protein
MLILPLLCPILCTIDKALRGFKPANDMEVPAYIQQRINIKKCLHIFMCGQHDGWTDGCSAPTSECLPCETPAPAPAPTSPPVLHMSANNELKLLHQSSTCVC